MRRFYLGNPNTDGIFVVDLKRDQFVDGISRYKFELFKDDERKAYFSLYNAPSVYHEISEHWELYVKPVCEYDNYPEKLIDSVETITMGEVELCPSGNWKVVKKAKIKYTESDEPRWRKVHKKVSQSPDLPTQPLEKVSVNTTIEHDTSTQPLTLPPPLHPQLVTVTKSKMFEDSSFKDPVAGDMIAVKGMVFMMGATKEQGDDCDCSEEPAHSVALSDYYIGKYLVTQKLWRRVMVGTSLADPSNFKGDDLPIESVHWNCIVNEFLPKLNAMTGKMYRLPTEAEWEYAARGGVKSKGYKYAGGNDIDNVAWYIGNSAGETHNVGTKEPNELGIYDMSGNVWEWVNDGCEIIDLLRNPIGPSSGSGRINRGGSWGTNENYCHVSYCDGNTPNTIDYSIGFRLALSSDK